MAFDYIKPIYGRQIKWVAEATQEHNGKTII